MRYRKYITEACAPDYDDIIRKQRAALNIRLGQVFKINARKYTVIEIYPHWIRLQSKDGRIVSMNSGQIVQFRNVKTTGATFENFEKQVKQRGKGRRIKNLCTGEIYKSEAALAAKLNVTTYMVRSRCELGQILKGDVYTYVE